MLQGEYIFLDDFRKVNDIFLGSCYDTYKLCITNHAFHRMYEEQNRQCNLEVVKDLLITKGDKICQLQNEEDFTIISPFNTVALHCKKTKIDGFNAIILKTVVRNVLIVNNKEYEQTLHIKYKNKRI